MPKKPIKPDRVRLPNEWRCAQVFVFLSLPLAVFAGGPGLYLVRGIFSRSIPTWFALVLAGLAFAPAIAYATHIGHKWRKRIERCDGQLCPNCAYALAGIEKSHTSVTCPECPYVIEETSRLRDRWRNMIENKGMRMRLSQGQAKNKRAGD